MCVREFHEVYNFEKGQDCSSCVKVLQPLLHLVASIYISYVMCETWKKISAHTQMNGQKKGLAAIMCLLKTCLWINDHKQLKYCLQIKT